MKKHESTVTVYLPRELKCKAAIYELDGKYYIVNSIANAFETLFYKGRFYAEVVKVGGSWFLK